RAMAPASTSMALDRSAWMRSTQNSTSPCSRVIRPILASRPQPPNSHAEISAACVTAMTLRITRSCPSVLSSMVRCCHAGSDGVVPAPHRLPGAVPAGWPARRPAQGIRRQGVVRAATPSPVFRPGGFGRLFPSPARNSCRVGGRDFRDALYRVLDGQLQDLSELREGVVEEDEVVQGGIA